MDTYPQVTIPNTEITPMTSTHTGGEFQILVSLPEDYMTATTARYPVVYLLDANYYFGAITDFIRVENLVMELPKLIIVGIGYPEKPLDRRVEDMADNPDAFLDFIEDELIPFVDGRYRTNASASDRAIAGHSLGGQFVLYTLFKRNELFERYVALSPGSPRDEMTEIEAEFATNNTGLPARLFMSASDNEPHIEPMFTTIQDRHYEGLRMSFMSIVYSTHVSSSIPAFVYGLRYVY